MSASDVKGGSQLRQSVQAAANGLWTISLLRGLASFWVVLSHADGLWWRCSPNMFFGKADGLFFDNPLLRIISGIVMGLGFLGVPLFFVISGFCIHLPQAGRSEPLNLRVFAVRRFFRLYPLYLIVVIVTMALLTLRSGWGSSPNLTIPNLLGHLVFWHYADQKFNSGMGISPVMWTLTIEVHFYILYAVTLPLLRRFGIGRCALILILAQTAYRAAWYSLGFFGSGGPEPYYPSRCAPIRFGEWLLGAYVAELYVSGRLSDWRKHARPFVLVAGGLLFVAAGVAFASAAGLRTHATDVPASVGFMFVLLGLLIWEAQRPPLTASLWTRLAAALGDRSYSLYLVHLTVMSGFMDLWVRLRHLSYKNQPGGSAEYLLVVLLGIALAFVTTEITYRLIEMPSHRLARRLAEKFRKRPDPGPALDPVTPGTSENSRCPACNS